VDANYCRSFAIYRSSFVHIFNTCISNDFYLKEIN
jgi:hypothetical protein